MDALTCYIGLSAGQKSAHTPKSAPTEPRFVGASSFVKDPGDCANSPGERPTPEEIDMADRTCSIDRCSKRAHSRNLCQMHYFRLRRTGDPNKLRTNMQGRGENHANWRGDQITYVGAHFRVRRERGPASQHSCIECGKPATEWSYDHNDINELHDDVRHCTYSADPEHYDPRCKTCHNRFDQSTERPRLANGRFTAASA